MSGRVYTTVMFGEASLSQQVADAVEEAFGVTAETALSLAQSGVHALRNNEDVERAVSLKTPWAGISDPGDLARLIRTTVYRIDKERMERLASAIEAMNPHGKGIGSALLFYDVIWSSICHRTERAARFFDGDSPEATLYNAIGYAFHVYGRSE
jgi:hypothetical protein